MRPNFHHRVIPTIAHVHVAVLAYHILAGISKKLRTTGFHYNWNTIRNILATHIRVTTTTNTEDGHVIDFSTWTTSEEKQHMIYNKLHIKYAPLGRKYMKSSVKTQRCSAENWRAKVATFDTMRDTFFACRTWVKPGKIDKKRNQVSSNEEKLKNGTTFLHHCQLLY